MSNPSPSKRTAPPPAPWDEGDGDGRAVRDFLGTREGLGFVRVVVRKYGRKPEDIDDMASAAIVRCLETAHLYVERGSLLGWISVVAVRVACTWRVRAGARERRVKDGVEGDGVDALPDGRGIQGVDPFLRAQLREIMAELGGDMLRAWWAMDVEGRRASEVAEDMGCALNTVLTRAYRMRAKLLAACEARGLEK